MDLQVSLHSRRDVHLCMAEAVAFKRVAPRFLGDSLLDGDINTPHKNWKSNCARTALNMSRVVFPLKLSFETRKDMRVQGLEQPSQLSWDRDMP